MSNEKKLKAKARDGSPITQTQIDKVEINNGISSYIEVKEIALDVFKSNFLKLSDEASKIAIERAEEVTNDFLEKNKDKLVDEVIKNPNFQLNLYEVQKNHAKTGDENIKEVSIDILGDVVDEMIKNKRRNLKQIVLEESLNVIPKLTVGQLDTLTIVFLLQHLFNNNITNPSVLKKYLNDEIKPFCTNLSKENSVYQHLEYTGCASVSIGSSSIEDIFKENYRGLFFKGFDGRVVDRLQIMGMSGKAFADLVTMQCINDNEKAQLSPININALEKKIIELEISDEISEELKKIFDQYILPNNKIKDKLIELGDDFMKDLFDIWDNSSIKNTTLTSVGIAIAQANYIRKTGESLDLGLWIK